VRSPARSAEVEKEGVWCTTTCGVRKLGVGFLLESEEPFLAKEVLED